MSVKRKVTVHVGSCFTLHKDGALSRREVLQGGQWVEAPVSAATVQRLEEIILTRARDLRRASSIG
jgi:hypothetical protein